MQYVVLVQRFDDLDNRSFTKTICVYVQNNLPTHIRGPNPNGTCANVFLTCSSSLFQRSGINLSGYSNTSGDLPIAVSNIATDFWNFKMIMLYQNKYFTSNLQYISFVSSQQKLALIQLFMFLNTSCTFRLCKNKYFLMKYYFACVIMLWNWSYNRSVIEQCDNHCWKYCSPIIIPFSI